MAEGDDNKEKQCLNFYSKQTSYGSTKKLKIKNDTFVKHNIQPGDTLQGISLKYGVSMEKLKCANGIWSNESFVIYEYLLIPAANSDSEYNNIIRRKHLSKSKSKTIDIPSTSPTDVSVNDMLLRFDSNLEIIKNRIGKLEEKSHFTRSATIQEDLQKQPDLVIRSPRNLKKSSMKKELQNTDDNIFQL